ncbi:hypothetical protein PTKIN_Ptkin12aG0078100 [Pterospermum kingtungense]
MLVILQLADVAEGFIELLFQVLGSLDQALKGSCMRWHKPPNSYLKCNIDAAIFSDSLSTGLGCIVRDSNGAFVASRMDKLAGLPTIKECEALALLEAVKWMLSLGLKNVVFEYDAKLVIDAIRSKAVDQSEFGSIILSC